MSGPFSFQNRLRSYAAFGKFVFPDNVLTPALADTFNVVGMTFTSSHYFPYGPQPAKDQTWPLQAWIGGIYEEENGLQLCHVFAGGQRLATFEPASGGPYASVWAPKTIWAQTAETADTIATWPLREGRTPWTVLLSTLVLLLVVCVQARRGLGVRSSPAAAMWMLRALAKLLRVATPRCSVRSARRANPTLVGRDSVEPWNSERGTGWREARELETQNPKLETELTARERRWFTQPLWRQAMSLLMIVALVFVTTPTEVQAQTYSPVFYYYHTDHLGSTIALTDREGVVVEQPGGYAPYGLEKCVGGYAFRISNRFTGQVADEDIGLYYYGSRYYDPALGRFIQPDTIVPNPGDSQQFNRYSYVNNNPLKYTDPTGHEAATAIIVGVIIGAAIGAAAAAAQGATGSGIALAAGLGALGGLFGGVGCWAGGVIGGATGSAAGTAVGSFVGAVAGGAAGGAVSASVTGGNVGTGALAGAVSGAIGFGVGQLGFSDPGTFGQYLTNAGLSAAGGAAGGAAGAALQGGDPGLGAAYGAAAGAAGYGLYAGLHQLSLGWLHSHTYGRVQAKMESGLEVDKKFTSAGDFVEWLDNVGQSGDKISYLKFVGHASSTTLEFGPHDLSWDRHGGMLTDGAPGPGAKSVNSIVQNAFTRYARINLCGCNTYRGGANSIAYGFKSVLPNANVYGYPFPVLSNFALGGSRTAAPLWRVQYP